MRGDLYRNEDISDPANRITANDPSFTGLILAYVQDDNSEFGDPFDTFSYVASDGLVAAASEVTDTITITSVGGPPAPDPVDVYVALPDDPAGVSFALRLADPGVDLFSQLTVWLDSLPQNEAFWLECPLQCPRVNITAEDLPFPLPPFPVPLPQSTEEVGWPFT